MTAAWAALKGQTGLRLPNVQQRPGDKLHIERKANAALIVAAVNSYSPEREAAWQGALKGLSRRDLVGWGSCWCDRNPASANIVDHESKCSAARAALADTVGKGE